MQLYRQIKKAFAKVNAQLSVSIGGGICRNQGNNIFIFRVAQYGDVHVDKHREFIFNKPCDFRGIFILWIQNKRGQTA